ncbi:hypothetical protein CDEST_00513 [Colletotrichum destructivum]|uniref:Uncharacterized protein n=1 Tax=Colletotrichum destructivum TaxID=34406 RepID=A0AAX4HWR8_9PEZI|nr:hypothetical protein CDEST_00513 [Colletotrichum destructivum]
MYPYEQILQYNPVRRAHFLESIKISTARLNYVLMSASGIETFTSGELTSPGLVFWLSHVCSVVNDHLSDRKMGWELDEGILECVATMAIFGYSGGRADHWNVHMNGHKQLTELHGGMQRSWGYLLNSIRRADVRGAAALGLTPHLDYHRFFEAPSKMLSLRLRTEISRDMSGILYCCGVQTNVVNAMTSMSLFAGVLRAASSSPTREMLFDPEAFIEEWLWCEYQLVKYPGPLRSDCSSACRRLPDKLYIAADLGSSEAVAEVMVETLRAQPVPPLVGNLLESALRAAAIMYIEVLVPDEPGSPLAHAILLNLLSALVQTIVQCLQERQSKTRNEKPRGNSCDDDDDDDDCLPSTATSKPVLIWICIVGFVVSKLYETDLAARGILFDRACYGQCLAMIVGLEPEDVDRLRDEDLALCRVLDARGLRIQPCDERVILKGLLNEHLYGVPARDLTSV